MATDDKARITNWTLDSLRTIAKAELASYRDLEGELLQLRKENEALRESLGWALSILSGPSEYDDEYTAGWRKAVALVGGDQP